MSTLDWSLQQATKTTAQIAAATTIIPLTGQIVWNTDTGKYCIGDGTTALSALTFYGGISASGLTVGTTTITGGTNTKVLYNNNGVVGEYTVTGTGSAVLNTDPTITGLLTINRTSDDFALKTTRGTVSFGVYLEAATTIPVSIGTESNHNLGFFTNYSNVRGGLHTNGNWFFGKQNFTSWNAPASFVELTAQSASAVNNVFAIRNSTDTTNLVTIGDTGIITSTVDLNVNKITSGTSVIKVATLDLTAAQIKAGSQVQVIAAQGAGTYIEVISASYFYTYVSAAYTSTTLDFYISGTSDAQMKTPSFLTATGNRSGRFIQEPPTSGRSNSMKENAALMIAANTSSVVGDTPVKVRVLYRVITP